MRFRLSNHRLHYDGAEDNSSQDQARHLGNSRHHRQVHDVPVSASIGRMNAVSRKAMSHCLEVGNESFCTRV